MSEHRHNEHHSGAGFEQQDLGSRPVYGFLISLVVIGVLTYYVLWGVFYLLEAYNRSHQPAVSPMVKAEQETREPVASVTSQKIKSEFSEPRLEDDERTELAPVRHREEQILNSYGWVDESAGVARIPITKAMELVAQRGLPTTPQAGTAPPSAVGMAQGAAAKADASGAQNNESGSKGNKKK
jgi:hypothetical protein